MKKIIEKGIMLTSKDEVASYIITMDKISNNIIIMEAKNEEKFHIYFYVNLDIEVYILGIVDIMFQYLEPSVLKKRIQINIKLFYEKKIDKDFDQIESKSYSIHIEKDKNTEDTIQYIKSKLRWMYEIHGILLIKDIKIQFICGEYLIEEE